MIENFNFFVVFAMCESILLDVMPQIISRVDSEFKCLHGSVMSQLKAQQTGQYVNGMNRFLAVRAKENDKPSTYNYSQQNQFKGSYEANQGWQVLYSAGPTNTSCESDLTSAS